MIRIVDEKIFSMTQEQHDKLLNEFMAGPSEICSFEDWLESINHFYTTYQQEHP